MKKSLVREILVAGLIVGTLDIIAACLSAYIKNSASTPDRVLRYIASGVFGKKAFVPANSYMIFIGLAFHYIIAYSFTSFFYVIYSRLKWFATNRLITGIVYGIFIWAVMFFLVLPLTQTPGKKLQFKGAPLGISILVIAIGIPLSFLAYRYFYSNSRRGMADSASAG